MKRYVIKGPNKGVRGTVNIEGAKNSCLSLMASSILFENPITFKNVPLVKDVMTMCNLLTALGSKVEISEKKKSITIINNKTHKLVVPYKLVSTMRAGCLLMGSLLGKYQKKKILVAQGGGCALGTRGIDFHISGFKALGAHSVLKKGYINISAKKGLVGNKFKFPKVTVTGTSNLIMASVLAKGKSILKNVSIEPEVIDLINFLKKCGAKIKFIGKRTIQIKGVKKLFGKEHEIIGDRIEAFSYLCVGAITRGKITIKNINPKYIYSELQALKKIGCKIDVKKYSITLSVTKKLKPIKIKTGPFPNYATDNMPLLMAVLTTVEGKSLIEETIFSNRYMAAPELARMGGKIYIKRNIATIIGQKKLYGADCISSDLRTTFSIILGAIVAHGTSYVSRVYHGVRGYYNLVGKLKKLGINIKSIS
jgi:UDP-N-acetylglucosamine 1-carboxyvinyltransferase